MRMIVRLFVLRAANRWEMTTSDGVYYSWHCIQDGDYGWAIKGHTTYAVLTRSCVIWV